MIETLCEFKGVRVLETDEIVSYAEKILIPKTQEEINKQAKAIQNFNSISEAHTIIKRNCEGFYFYFYEKMKNIDMINSMKTRFLFLCCFMSYNTDNSILIDTDESTSARTPLTKSQLKEKLKLTEREFQRTMKLLCDRKLIKVNENGHYHINTDMIFRGTLSLNQKKSKYTRIFMEGIKELYDNCTTLQHKTLYIFLMLLPNINLRFNCVCTEESIEKEIENEVNCLSMKQICELIGYDKSQSKRLWNDLRKFKIDNNYVIAMVSIGEKEFIKINPKVYYKGTNAEDLRALMRDFGLIEK